VCGSPSTSPPSNPTRSTPLPDITLYSKPGCVQCRATVKRLQLKRLDYTYVDVTESDDAWQKAAQYGISQMPIVVAGDQVWGGYKPEAIDALSLEVQN